VFTRLLSRRWIYPAVAVVAVALVGLNPSWAKAVGVDVWNLPTLEQEFQDAKETSKELTLLDCDIQERIVAKETKIDELKAGRRTLAEVTDEFLALNQSRPSYMVVIRTHYEGRTDREKVARNVIHYVRTRMDDPAEEAAVLSHLDAELNEMNTAEPPATP
jgi:hypothetical protein